MSGITRRLLALAVLALFALAACSTDAGVDDEVAPRAARPGTVETVETATETEEVAPEAPATDAPAIEDAEAPSTDETPPPGGDTTTTETGTTDAETVVIDVVRPVVDIVSSTAYLAVGEVGGSGVIMDGTDLILTNYHVVAAAADGTEPVIVFIAGSEELEPVPVYVAEVAAYDEVLDLAVVEIVMDLGGNDVEVTLDGFELGDSDGVHVMDELTIVGFPSVGGTTISVTNGMVSGFETEDPVGVRAWIKTDSAISAGNSGGPALNADFQVVGISTLAGAVEFGGELNFLRPVNFALPLVEAAQGAQTYESPYDIAEEISTPPAADVTIEGVEFFDVTTYATVEAYPSGATNICADFVVAGIVVGTEVSHEWYLDGELVNDGVSTWEAEGDRDLRCLNNGGETLPDGTYELAVSIGNDFAVNSAGVGTGVSEVTFVNDGTVPVCEVEVAALAAAFWGPNQINGPLAPGEQISFDVAAGTVDVRIHDCDGNELIVATEIQLEEVDTLTYSN